MKILIFGTTGMLGHSLFNELSKNHDVYGVIRANSKNSKIFSNTDTSNITKISGILESLKPDFVINSIGIIKQLKQSKDKIQSIEVNSIWPHQLAELCAKHNAKMIHFSTDCVFTGSKGNYNEEDLADARDTYGLSKFMGEVDYPHTLTLRTSIIGHELNSSVSLIDWFLSQSTECKGFTEAIYSGFPTVEIANFLNEYIFKNFVSGVYHLSSEPISKYDLLKIVAEVYGKPIQINPSQDLKIDRSLNSDKLRSLVGFKPKNWPELVKSMHGQFLENYELYKNKGIYNDLIRK